MFRSLKADEIECRVQSINGGNYLTLLLYKDARCDMNILDETVGAMEWKREHTRDNHNCVVSIWDKEKKQWISKEDTGTESNTEKAKGLASDSFKRACFNWGIGRELYSSPLIQFKLEDKEVYSNNGRKGLGFGVKFHVAHIEVTDGKITALGIKDQTGKWRFKYKEGE